MMLGIAIAEIGQRDRIQDKAHRNYGLVGAGLGLVVGSAQEAIRQTLQDQQDQAEPPPLSYGFQDPLQEYRQYLDRKWRDS
jgi:hypothetical protein